MTPWASQLPFILPAKMLLKDMCKLDFGWDATILDETLVKRRTKSKISLSLNFSAGHAASNPRTLD